MCGIAGELAFGAAADVAAVQRMAATMADRGPDGAGSWSHDAVALAHRRLKIIDLSCAGDQPMTDPALGLTIVFNGCIYNHRELRAELERDGARFFSTSDTEVILKAYDRWGRDCVTHFKGMFAFAVYEHESRRLLLARDRLGVKPLYLADVDGAVRFASTLPALLAGGGVDTALDPVALHHYLSWHAVVPAPHTILTGVRKLAPATTLLIGENGERDQRCYWEPDFGRQERYADYTKQDWDEAVLETTRAAVKRRMVADVPVGVLLSGGLDSTRSWPTRDRSS
jgi:asparagine synthase (glutamine-hydrolysing)